MEGDAMLHQASSDGRIELTLLTGLISLALASSAA
jgi:hypothetical protein